MERAAEIKRLREELLRADERLMALATKRDATETDNARLREALQFYAEDFTWARVGADARAGCDRFFSYAKKARAALEDRNAQ